MKNKHKHIIKINPIMISKRNKNFTDYMDTGILNDNKMVTLFNCVICNKELILGESVDLK